MKYKIDRKWKWLWGCMLGAAWISLLILLLKNRGGLSVEDILRCQPESKGKVILVMLGLFTLKSVDFLLHSGVLYAADGVMFSLPTAIAINLLGAAVMVTPPFFIGRTMGEPMLNELTEKHPKIRQIAEIPEKTEFVVNILLRMTGLPLLPVALYVGAAKGRYAPYLFGSLLGLLPTLVAYTVMGVGIGDRSSPVFWIAFGSLGCVNAASIVLSGLSVFHRIGLRLGIGAVFPKMVFLFQSGAQMDQPRFLYRPISANLRLWALRPVSSGTAGQRYRA